MIASAKFLDKYTSLPELRAGFGKRWMESRREIRAQRQKDGTFGASSGIGAAVARRFATCGANVLIHFNSNRAGAEAVATEIQKAGGRANVIGGDVSDGKIARGWWTKLWPASAALISSLTMPVRCWPHRNCDGNR